MQPKVRTSIYSILYFRIRLIQRILKHQILLAPNCDLTCPGSIARYAERVVAHPLRPFGRIAGRFALSQQTTHTAHVIGAQQPLRRRKGIPLGSNNPLIHSSS